MSGCTGAETGCRVNGSVDRWLAGVCVGLARGRCCGK